MRVKLWPPEFRLEDDEITAVVVIAVLCSLIWAIYFSTYITPQQRHEQELKRIEAEAEAKASFREYERWKARQ